MIIENIESSQTYKIKIKKTNEKQFAVIGDIHGEIEKLESVLKQLDKQYPNIQIYSTGDLVDRGLNSKEVIDAFIDRGIISVVGNHDECMFKALTGNEFDWNAHTFEGMGGFNTVKSYIKERPVRWDCQPYYKEAVSQSHKDYLYNQPLAVFIKTHKWDYLLTHAGISSGIWNNLILDYKCNYKDGEFKMSRETIIECMENYSDNIIWTHTKHLQNFLPIEIVQISGHLPVEHNEIIRDHSIMIDTDSGKGGKLSAIILPDMKIIQSE